MIYRTREGDVLDAVCARHYRVDAPNVEAVLDANPGLADLGPILPGGLLIDLPDAASAAPAPQISLWD